MNVVDTTVKTIPLQNVVWGRCFKHNGAVLMRVKHVQSNKCGCVDLDSGDVKYLSANTQVISVEAAVTVRNKS